MVKAIFQSLTLKTFLSFDFLRRLHVMKLCFMNHAPDLVAVLAAGTSRANYAVLYSTRGGCIRPPGVHRTLSHLLFEGVPVRSKRAKAREKSNATAAH
jgi:hypothetical protein